MPAGFRRELIDYIRRLTGLDETTIVKVLRAEESFFASQIERALKGRGGEGR